MWNIVLDALEVNCLSRRSINFEWTGITFVTRTSSTLNMAQRVQMIALIAYDVGASYRPSSNVLQTSCWHLLQKNFSLVARAWIDETRTTVPRTQTKRCTTWDFNSDKHKGDEKFKIRTRTVSHTFISALFKNYTLTSDDHQKLCHEYQWVMYVLRFNASSHRPPSPCPNP